MRGLSQMKNGGAVNALAIHTSRGLPKPPSPPRARVEVHMSYKARCPQCDEWMEVERVDNGVMMVWHGVS